MPAYVLAYMSCSVSVQRHDTCAVALVHEEGGKGARTRERSVGVAEKRARPMEEMGERRVYVRVCPARSTARGDRDAHTGERLVATPASSVQAAAV